MESFLLRPQLPAILDKPDGERSIHDADGIAVCFRRTVFVDPGFLSFCRAFDQIWLPLLGLGIYDFLPVRGYRTTENSPLPIPDGRRGALFVLSPSSLNLRIPGLRSRLSSCGRGIDNFDYLVLPILPRRRDSHADDWRRFGRYLHFSLHYFAARGLRASDGGDCALHPARRGDVRDAQSRLVCP